MDQMDNRKYFYVTDSALKLVLSPTAMIPKSILPYPTALSALGSQPQSTVHTSKHVFLLKLLAWPGAPKTEMAPYCL